MNKGNINRMRNILKEKSDGTLNRHFRRPKKLTKYLDSRFDMDEFE